MCAYLFMLTDRSGNKQRTVALVHLVHVGELLESRSESIK